MPHTTKGRLLTIENLTAAKGRPCPMPAIDHFTCQDTAKQAFAIVQTGKQRLYGWFILRKGVIAPKGHPP